MSLESILKTLHMGWFANFFLSANIQVIFPLKILDTNENWCFPGSTVTPGHPLGNPTIQHNSDTMNLEVASHLWVEGSVP